MVKIKKSKYKDIKVKLKDLHKKNCVPIYVDTGYYYSQSDRLYNVSITNCTL